MPEHTMSPTELMDTAKSVFISAVADGLPLGGGTCYEIAPDCARHRSHA
jgi:hypothetical protein